MQQQKESILDLSIGEKYMLTLREASVYFHIGIKYMRRLAENNDGEFALKSHIHHLSHPSLLHYL